MIWVLTFLIALIGGMFIHLSNRCCENDHTFWGVTCFVPGISCIILAIILFIASCCWTGTVTNLDAEQAKVAETGITYIQMAHIYEQQLIAQDMTGSDSYLELYEKIAEYNKAVRQADRWKDCWWASGIMYDPAYAEASILKWTN